MAYPYKSSLRGFRFPQVQEAQSSTILKAAEERGINSFSSNRESDSSSTTTLVTDGLQELKIPTRLIIALTCAFGGLQLVFSTIFSHGTPYLFSLGSSKWQSSLIWAIGPICGTVVQPIVGGISDNSRFRWGRRRPFILGGAISTAISLIALAWVSNISCALAAVVGVHSEEGIKTTTQIGVLICITLLNISIQPVQSGLRALVVDICPSEQQSIASAWAGRFIGLGNILGYMLGWLPLDFISHDNESWRFRFLSIVSVVVLMTTVLVTIYFIREDDPREFAYEPQEGMLLLRIVRTVKDGWSSMPKKSQHVCLVQFFAWMGWFGFLFYNTSYIGQLYISESIRHGIEFSNLRDAGIRLGTFANLLNAVMAFVTIIIAPYFAATNYRESLSEKLIIRTVRIRWWRQTHIIWAMSHLLYASCIFCTIFVTSTNTAIFLVALTGVSWGITQWAPFALLGEDIAMNQAGQDSAIERGDRQWMSNQSGAIMGIHNAAISIPQILAALASSFIFMLEGNRTGKDNGIVWVLRTAGVAALVAAYFAWRLKK